LHAIQQRARLDRVWGIAVRVPAADRKFNADGQPVYDNGHVEGEAPGLLANPPGMLGDTILVNGIPPTDARCEQ
jgi:hypothetical protein